MEFNSGFKGLTLILTDFMMARRPIVSVKEKLKCVSCGNMWSSKVLSNQDVSNDIRVTELKSTIQTRKFLENQLHSTCVIQLYSIQVSITELLVPSVQQKSSGLKFSKSRTGSHLTYSCHHNSSRFSFPTFVNSWRFSVFHSLKSITPRIY